MTLSCMESHLARYVWRDDSMDEGETGYAISLLFLCVLDYISLSKSFKIWAFHSWRGGPCSPWTFVRFFLSLEMWALLALGHTSIIHL
jgi:hypothetical protein